MGMKKRDRDNYFMQIYNKTIDKAFYVALSIVKNQDTAYDILQDSYLQVLQSIEKIYDRYSYKVLFTNIPGSNG